MNADHLPIDHNRARQQPMGLCPTTTKKPRSWVTTFPGEHSQSGPLVVSSGDHYELVDVTGAGDVRVVGGEAEILDASGFSRVVIGGGVIRFLMSVGASTANILGGVVEFITVQDQGTVNVLGTNLRCQADVLAGVLADGTPIRAELTVPGGPSVWRLPGGLSLRAANPPCRWGRSHGRWRARVG